MNPLRGILLKVLSVCVFVTMFSLIKSTADQIPPGQAVFFRSFWAIPVLIAWLVLRGDFPYQLKAIDPMGHLWRGLMGSIAMGSGFLAIGLLPLPEVVAIGYTAPFLVTILAAMFLGERVRLVRLLALVFGLTGVALVVSPRLSLTDVQSTTTLQSVGVFAALMAAVFSALAQVFARKLVATETTGSIVFYFSCMSCMLSLLTLPFGWQVPSLNNLFLLVLAGVLGGVGQILLTESYRHAEVAVIASFEYSSIILATVIGYFVFNETLSARVLIGVSCITTAGIVIIVREHRLGIRQASEAAASDHD